MKELNVMNGLSYKSLLYYEILKALAYRAGTTARFTLLPTMALVAERSKPVNCSAEVRLSGGSNPTLSLLLRCVIELKNNQKSLNKAVN